MPELPEVQTIVAELAGRVAGRTMTHVDLRRADIVTPRAVDFPKLITGRRIASLTRRGKRILFTLDNHHGFYIHLGMTGRLTIRGPGSASPEPALHTHLILTFDTGLQLHFTDPRRFGGLFWLAAASGDQDLGPEPLTLTPPRLARRLHNTARPIKSALLDQRLIAGLGNIYVDESLHAAGLHPLIPANALTSDQIQCLNRAIKSTLRRALSHGGSTLRDYRTATGEKGNFQKIHRVYARQGQPCLTCGTPIERIVLTGRSTCFCPKCQHSSSLRRFVPPSLRR
jgi:formamidopyrimidine-DNA glycosylase